MHLDTCFLVDLQRERSTRAHGAAHAFLAKHPEEPMAISVVTAMEYLEGFEDGQLWTTDPFLDLFACVPLNLQAATRASRIRRNLRRSGSLIPDADILIAASALVAGEPLVTDNTAHFARVDGLDVRGYR